MTDWKPIETAAVEGDDAFQLPGVMVLIPNSRWPVKMGFWRKSDKRWGWYGSSGIRHEKQNQPTHWMPLPPPPSNRY